MILIVTSVDIYLDWLGIILAVCNNRRFFPRFDPSWLSGFTAVLAVAAIAHRAGPWTTKLYYDQETAVRALVTATSAMRPTFVVGDYWKTWPVVLETLAARQAAGEARPAVFGITYRGDAAKKLANRAFSRDAHPVALCIALSREDCVKQLFSIVTPPSAEECVEILAEGQAPDASYTVIGLKREDTLPCSGNTVSSILK
jgi:hypothetical protein